MPQEQQVHKPTKVNLDIDKKESEEKILRKEENANAKSESVEAVVVVENKKVAETGSKKKLNYKEKLEFEQLEKDIAKLEEEKLKITNLLNTSSDNHEDAVKWSAEIGKIISELDEKSFRWMELSE